jgi:hypothetical protein
MLKIHDEFVLYGNILEEKVRTTYARTVPYVMYVYLMERLDQGHLHPKLEVSAGNRTRSSAVGGEHSNKELFDSIAGIITCYK